ncbi:hypothetical protein L1987_59651 [Smallanthus sonchifolius]|uniref:Uncharacterized protein n=1 Tax=Smallanthus sonchifolius TaxID=185202 RepID=A0ACB9D6P1_9ASTR|nr:hypothetical protein L1987_59651 [Smallanthus sonchifolius]
MCGSFTYHGKADVSCVDPSHAMADRPGLVYCSFLALFSQNMHAQRDGQIEEDGTTQFTVSIDENLSESTIIGNVENLPSIEFESPDRSMITDNPDPDSR